MGEPQRRLNDRESLYLCEDEIYDKVSREVDLREREKGVKSIEMDYEYCPALAAENKQSKIEDEILDECGKKLGLNHKNISLVLEHRKRFLDLTIRFIVQYKL